MSGKEKNKTKKKAEESLKDFSNKKIAKTLDGAMSDSPVILRSICDVVMGMRDSFSKEEKKIRDDCTATLIKEIDTLILEREGTVANIDILVALIYYTMCQNSDMEKRSPSYKEQFFEICKMHAKREMESAGVEVDEDDEVGGEAVGPVTPICESNPMYR